MSDFPNLYTPNSSVIHSGGLAALNEVKSIAGNTFGGGGTWPAANRALYIPFLVFSVVTAYQMAFEVVTQNGNYDIGIYSEQGDRLVSTGSTLVPAAGKATANITDTTLTPALYFMALSCDSTTASFLRSSGLVASHLQVLGLQQEALGSVTLPATATFANPANAYLPAVSIAQVLVI